MANLIKRKVTIEGIRFNKQMYEADFLKLMQGKEVFIEDLGNKRIIVYRDNTKVLGDAVQKRVQQQEKSEVLGMFKKLANVGTDELVKELASRTGITTIKNKEDQLLKVTAGVNSRIKEKCEATVLIVRSA